MTFDRKGILKRLQEIPIYRAMEFELLELSSGACSFKVPRRKEWDGVFESFHGGLIMTVADSAACIAVLTLAGAASRLTTTDMNIRFLAPCRTDLVVKARVIKFGKTLCPVSIDCLDENQTLVALAQVNYFRL